jgi:hypothetical protein
MKSQMHYYRMSGPIIGVWMLGMVALLLAFAIVGTLPLGERVAMFLP